MRIYQPGEGGTDSRSEEVLLVSGRDRTIVGVRSTGGRSRLQRVQPSCATHTDGRVEQ